MRAFILAPFLLATTAMAEDFIVNPPVVSAVVHPTIATTVQKITLTLPAGQHRVLFPKSKMWLIGVFNVHFTGDITQQGSDIVLTQIDGGTLFTPAQAAAHDAFKATNDRLLEIKGEKSELMSRIAALQNQLAFLGSINGADTTDKTVTDLLAMAKMIGGESAKILAEIAGIEADFPALNERIAVQTRAASRAELAFEATGASDYFDEMIAVNIMTTTNTKTEMSINGFEEAAWEPSYEFHLTRGETPEITVKRSVSITLREGVTWQDIDLTLSSSDPLRQLEPGHIRGSLAQIEKTILSKDFVTLGDNSISGFAMEAPIVVEEAAVRREAFVMLDGETVVYHFDFPATIVGIDEPSNTLQLADLTFTPEISYQTHPRTDDTAFVIAKFNNSAIDPIFEGFASFYRDGVLIGVEDTTIIPAKGEATLPFGPIDRIRVTSTQLNRETGDRGFLTTSNTRTEAIEFTVENLGDTAADVRALYPTPYSEQEDLEISVTANPAANDTNVENQRGVSAWDLTLAAGEKKTVRLNFDLSWPEGYELNWRP